jgi:hypothetical protein
MSHESFSNRETARSIPDLTIGVDLTTTSALRSNAGLASMGPALGGRSFVLSKSEAEHLSASGPAPWLRRLTTGKDITERHRDRFAIDVKEFQTEDALRKAYPRVYQHLKETIYPERSTNNDPRLRAYWWRFRRSNEVYLGAIENLTRFIATVETTKHRVFVFVDKSELLEHGVIGFGSSDAYIFGILSSAIHVHWTLANGGTLEDRPRYNKDVCFDPFPFPSPSELLKAQIRSVAEELNTFRKQQQKEHPSLTLTQMYNVLEKLRAKDVDGRNKAGHDDRKIALTADEERIKDEGLILILKELHEKLDRLVFHAYGWPETLNDEEILERLVALNRERAAEERRGHVRWLRPDYQIPHFGKDVDKQAAKEEGAQIAADLGLPEPSARKPSFPTDPVAQTAAVFAVLAAARGPTSAAILAANFRKTKSLEKTIFEVLASLARLGHVTSRDGENFEIRRIA